MEQDGLPQHGDISKTKLSITLGQFDEMRNTIKTLRRENAELRKAKEDRGLGSDDSVTRDLHASFQQALKVVHFAVSELHPMTVRGWPHEALAAVADAIDRIPALTSFEKETSNDLRLFAADCKYWEDQRAAGTEQEALREMNAARGPIQIPGT